MVQEWLRGSPKGLGVVVRPSQGSGGVTRFPGRSGRLSRVFSVGLGGVGRPSQKSERGREALREV